MKMTISIDENLAKRIEDYSKQNHMTKSGFISFACKQMLNSFDVATVIKEVSQTVNIIAEKDKMDKQTQKQLNDLKKISDVLDMCKIITQTKV